MGDALHGLTGSHACSSCALNTGKELIDRITGRGVGGDQPVPRQRRTRDRRPAGAVGGRAARARAGGARAARPAQRIRRPVLVSFSRIRTEEFAVPIREDQANVPSSTCRVILRSDPSFASLGLLACVLHFLCTRAHGQQRHKRRRENEARASSLSSLDRGRLIVVLHTAPRPSFVVLVADAS